MTRSWTLVDHEYNNNRYLTYMCAVDQNMGVLLLWMKHLKQSYMYLGLTKTKQLLYDFMLHDSIYYYFNDAMLNASV